jgi:uncharacterized membrane protein
MAKDVADIVGSALGKVAREAVQSVSENARKGPKRMSSNGPLAGGAGVAAAVGLAALAPIAARRVGGLVKGAGQKAGQKLGENAKEAVSQSTGGLGGLAKDAGKSLLPGLGGGGDKGGSSKGQPGVGKGRRMPVQQDIDIGVPLKTVYNQWTQFEEWPKFMHRVQQVTQEDETHVSFKAKIWGISKEFKAEITEQRPDECVKWRVTEGMTHRGIVTFHELGPRLTRVELNLEVEPGSMIEKAARGMRHVKRAARADMARFKAYVLMEEDETGSWRGTIDDGDVKRARRRTSGGSSRSRSSSATGGRGRSTSTQRGSSSKRGGGRSTRRSTSSSTPNKSSRSTSARGSSSSSNGRSGSTRARSSSSSNGRSRSTSSGTAGRKKTASRS